MTGHPLLRTVKSEHRFYLPDGKSMACLKDLATALPVLPEAMYKHHVNFAKNDFHSWVSHVIKDTHLSKEIKDVKDQKRMSMLVAKRVAELEGRDARREISQAIAAAQRQATELSPPKEMITPQLKPLNHTPKKSRPRIRATGISRMASGKKVEMLEMPESGPAGRPSVAKRGKTRSKTRAASKQERAPQANALEMEKDETELMPAAPAPFYASRKTGSGYHAPCDHGSHFSCIRCGLMEFGMGLAVGIVTTLMLARAFL